MHNFFYFEVLWNKPCSQFEPGIAWFSYIKIILIYCKYLISKHKTLEVQHSHDS